MKQMRNWMNTLTQDVTISKQDFLLSVLVGILGGIILGMLISPRKYMHIGCNNGNSYDLTEEELKS